MYCLKILVLAFLLLLVESKKAKVKPDWAKKDIRDYTDADMERLLDQWEVGAVYVYTLQS